MARAFGRLLMIGAVFSVAGLAAITGRSATAKPQQLFNIGNIYGVSNGASAPSIFTTSRPWHLVEVWTYHWNDAKGVSPGTIGVKSLTTGKMYGPWHAIGTEGQGGVPDAYWHVKVSVDLPVGRYKVVDSDPGTWAQNSETSGRGMSWAMATPLAEEKWPALPSALVSIASVSNGCGGEGWSEFVATQNLIGNSSTYVNSNVNPLAASFTVSFVDACNLHDAGYAGAMVKDELNGGVIDYYAWNQSRVDYKFLEDMRLLCDKQITDPKATIAITKCKKWGGTTSIGAMHRYSVVTAAGKHFYIARPQLNGTWANGGSGADSIDLRISHKAPSRLVTATWESGAGDELVKGEFRGTLITRADGTFVKGFSRLTTGGAKGAFHSMGIMIRPDSPNTIRVSGTDLSGAMTRV